MIKTSRNNELLNILNISLGNLLRVLNLEKSRAEAWSVFSSLVLWDRIVLINTRKG